VTGALPALYAAATRESTFPRPAAAATAALTRTSSGTARLAAAKQPPLGAKAPGHAYAKLRRQGDPARARLAEGRQARPRPATAALPSPPPVGGTRRIMAGQKRVGALRLQAKILKMEKELAAMQPADKRRGRLREDVAAARRLLAHWSDVVH
jgi:hypothetical protein